MAWGKIVISILNQTGRDLKLLTNSIPYGKWEALPPLIKNQEIGVYNAESQSAGYQFQIQFQDVPPVASAIYGTMTISVDVPRFSSENKSSVTTSGLLEASGWEPLPKGEQDFTRAVTVTFNDI
jgi:hypothetical protein